MSKEIMKQLVEREEQNINEQDIIALNQLAAEVQVDPNALKMRKGGDKQRYFTLQCPQIRLPEGASFADIVHDWVQFNRAIMQVVNKFISFDPLPFVKRIAADHAYLMASTIANKLGHVEIYMPEQLIIHRPGLTFWHTQETQVGIFVAQVWDPPSWKNLDPADEFVFSVQPPSSPKIHTHKITHTKFVDVRSMKNGSK